jgi:hypothetical protein
MNTPGARHDPCVALFDLDGTLTWRDTLLPFLAGYLIRHPQQPVGLVAAATGARCAMSRIAIAAR